MLREEESRAHAGDPAPGAVAEHAGPARPPRGPNRFPNPPRPLYQLAYGLFWVLLRPALALLGGLRVEGAQHVPRAGGVILAPNHASYSDPPIMGLACPRVLWFMTKAPLFDHPLLGTIMRLFHAYPVEVERVDREAIRFTEQLLEKGEAVCIFPEGGVSGDGRLMALKSGLALIALRTGVPVVPVALVGTNGFLRPGSQCLGRAPGGVHVIFGPPLALDGLPREGGRQEQLEWLTRSLREAIAALLPEEHLPGEEVKSQK